MYVVFYAVAMVNWVKNFPSLLRFASRIRVLDIYFYQAVIFISLQYFSRNLQLNIQSEQSVLVVFILVVLFTNIKYLLTRRVNYLVEKIKYR